MDNNNSNDLQVIALVEAMNKNNSFQKYTPYKGYEITESRLKYHLLNSILSNEQRSAVFLIDRETLDVYKARGYGKRGHLAGTVESITESYVASNEKIAAILASKPDSLLLLTPSHSTPNNLKP